MGDCVFCRILAGDLPASFVHQDELCVAFMDIMPVTAGHVLVVPRAHAQRMAEVEDATLARIIQVAKRVGNSLRALGAGLSSAADAVTAAPGGLGKGPASTRPLLRCEDVNLFLADGEVAMQEVPHFHLHVIPRFRGDGFGLRFPRGYGRHPGRAELDAVAADLAID